MLYPMESVSEAPAIDQALPASVARAILDLVSKVAMCSQGPSLEREVVLTIRRRPIDRQGHAGCRVEIWTNGLLPPGGLRGLREADGGGLLLDQVAAASYSASEQEAIASMTLELKTTIMGGWMLTIDARWHP